MTVVEGAARAITLRVLVAGLPLAASLPAHSGDWQTEAYVSAGGIYTDNICLTQSNAKSQWVATATPGVRVTGEGSRVSMDMLAALEFNTISNGSLDCTGSGIGGGGLGFGQKESPAPMLRLNAEATLVEDWLFLAADAFVDQNKINPFGVGGGDNLNGSGNTNTSYRYSVSPFISRRLSPSADFLLRYSYDEQTNTESLVNDSVSNLVSLDAGVDPALEKFSYGVSAEYSKVEFDDSFGGGDTFNNELSSARVRMAFQLTSQWNLDGYVGEEWNDFVSVLGDVEGVFWDVGIRWTPNSRISVAAGYGDRFFGATPRFEINYRHKKSSIRASYQRDITYSRNLRSSDQFSSNIDELLGDTVTQVGDVQANAGAPTTVANSPILDERFVLVYTFQARRSTLNLNASHSRQKRAEDGFEDTFINFGISFQRSLMRNLSFVSRLTWEDRQADDARGGLNGILGRDSDTWRALLGLEYGLSTSTDIFVDYQYSQRNSEFDLDQYEENRLSLTLRYQF